MKDIKILDDSLESILDYEKNKKNIELFLSKERLKYKEAIDLYNIFIDEVVKFLNTLDLSNPLEYSLAISHLIHYGYLSYNGEFNELYEPNETTGKYSLSIINGNGCCRNVSDIHKDIMDKLNLYCKKFYCYQTKHPIIINNKYPNHVLNLINFDNQLYGIDLFNYDRLFSFRNQYQLQSKNLLSPIYLTYKPLFEIYFGESNLEDINKTIELFKESSKKKHISSFEYEFHIKDRIQDYLCRQVDSFEEFSNSTTNIKNDIHRLTLNKK